jgi:hypothetical protein
LVAIGRFHVWWPMEGEGKTPFHLFHFPPTNFTYTLNFFPLTSRFYFTMVLSHYSRLSFPFLRFINYDCALQRNKSFTPSLSIWFWLKIWPFSLPWNYGVAHGHILRVASYSSEWRTTSGVVSRSYPNTTSSWWRTRTSRGACSFWSRTSLSMVLSYFSELSHLGDLPASWPRFWWWTWDRLWKLLQN